MKKRLWSLIVLVVVFLISSVLTSMMAKAQEMVWNTNPTSLPSGIAYHASVVHNNKIYVIGGTSPISISARVFFADISSDGTISSWTETTSLPEPRGGITNAVTMWNNFIYAAGGNSASSPGERNDVWYAEIKADGTLGNWMTTTPMPWRARQHFAVMWDGWIYIGGGTDGYGWKDYVAYAKINPDGSLGNWNYTTSLPLAYGAMGALASNGKIYLIGGTSTWGGPGLSHKEVYYASINPDGSLGTWLATTPLPGERENSGAVLFGKDIYVTGGQKTPENIVYGTVYRSTINMDGSIGTWQSLQNLPEPREGHSSVIFGNRIYTLGGTYKGYKDTIYYSPLPIQSPFWAQWWFWTIVTLGIIAIAFALTTIYYHKQVSVPKEIKATSIKQSSKECKVCPNCGANLPADSKFCGKCGASLQ